MNIALVIGISSYLHCSQLPAAINDAIRIKKLLESTEKYAEIKFISGDAENTSFENVKREYCKFIGCYLGKSIKEFFFYYSGHGIINSEDFYMPCSDYSESLIRSTSISDTEINDQIRSLEPDLTVKIIDACHSGKRYIKDIDYDSDSKIVNSKVFKDYICMASCYENQQSESIVDISFFTEKFIEGSLSKKINEKVYYREIKDFITEEFKSFSKQKPYFISQGPNDELFANCTNKMIELKNELYNDISKLNLELTEEFREFLQNTGVKFVHGRRENIFLNDLFVYPDLRVLDETVESLEKITSNIPSKKILQYQSNILILGEEQSGKTSLAKRIFQDALQDGFLPVFIIDGADIKKNFKIHEEIPFLLSNIYEYKLNEECIKKSKSICIIDDFSSSKLNVQATNEFLRSLNSIFSYVILFAKETFRYSILDYEILHGYKKFEIANFGNVHLGKIIEKWVELDSDEETNEKQILSQTDELRRHIESLVGKNIVPAKPFYILLLLQSFEILNPNKIEVTTYAHCYEYLIYQCLKRIDITKGNKVEMYLNVLSELGGEILDSSSESLDENSLEDFFIKYSKKFLIDNQNKVIDNLVKSSILQKTENGIKFRYHYLFYFFAAKKLATSLHRGEEAMDKIKALVKVVHLEKASNIILFVTHHTKDPSVLNEILLSVMDLFSEEEEMTLETESLSFLQDFIKQIPELVLENRDVKEERLRRDIQKDIAEQELSQTNQRETEMEQEDFVVNVNKLFRSIEVCGQLFRNRLNSLEREHLEIIYEESASVSLRFLNIFRRFCEFSKKELIEKIRTISDENPKISNSKIVKKVESWYLGINYMVILAMLHKIAFSLGSYEGREIYSVVTQGERILFPKCSLRKDLDQKIGFWISR